MTGIAWFSSCLTLDCLHSQSGWYFRYAVIPQIITEISCLPSDGRICTVLQYSFTNGKLSSAVLQSEATSVHPTIHTVNCAPKSNMEIVMKATTQVAKTDAVNTSRFKLERWNENSTHNFLPTTEKGPYAKLFSFTTSTFFCHSQQQKMLLDCQQCHLWPIKSISAAIYFIPLANTSACHLSFDSRAHVQHLQTRNKSSSLSTVKRHWRLSTHKEGSMENMEETGASTSRTISNLLTYLRRTFMLLCICFLRHQVPGHLTNLGSFL